MPDERSLARGERGHVPSITRNFFSPLPSILNMEGIRIVTNVDKIRSYQAHCRELAGVIQPLLKKMLAHAQQAKKKHHSIHHLTRNDRVFLLSIEARPFRADCRIYHMIPAPAYFEVIVYDEDKRMYYLFDHHFFERYAQRMSIEHFSHPDILKHYIRHNPVMVFEHQSRSMRKGYSHQIYAMTRQGLIHAELDTQVVVLYTFISSPMLTASQRRASRSLWYRLNKRSKPPLSLASHE